MRAPDRPSTRARGRTRCVSPLTHSQLVRWTRGEVAHTQRMRPTQRAAPLPSVTSSRVQTQHIAPWCTPVTLLQTRAGRISKAAVAIRRKGVPRLTASRAHGPDYICKALAWDRCGRQSVRSACISPPPQHPDRSHNPKICDRLCRGIEPKSPDFPTLPLVPRLAAPGRHERGRRRARAGGPTGGPTAGGPTAAGAAWRRRGRRRGRLRRRRRRRPRAANHRAALQRVEGARASHGPHAPPPRANAPPQPIVYTATAHGRIGPAGEAQRRARRPPKGVLSRRGAEYLASTPWQPRADARGFPLHRSLPLW